MLKSTSILSEKQKREEEEKKCKGLNGSLKLACFGQSLVTKKSYFQNKK